MDCMWVSAPNMHAEVRLLRIIDESRNSGSESTLDAEEIVIFPGVARRSRNTDVRRCILEKT